MTSDCSDTDYFDGSSFLDRIFALTESWLSQRSESPILIEIASAIHQSLDLLGVPLDYHPSPLSLCRLSALVILVWIGYYLLLGRRQNQRRQKLTNELRLAQEQIRALSGEKKDIRLFMDGAFDMMHFGHMNAFRLARSLGTHLVVGVNSDETIIECKGPPLMNDEERLTMVESCKFVDEVLPKCPYILSAEYLDWVIEKYKIDYVVHGDDPCIVDGRDVYETAKQKGKFRTFPRTEGVSTTDILGRMLFMSEQDRSQSDGAPPNQRSNFLTTGNMIRLFSEGVQAPPPGAKVIYMDGAFDMFHCGHATILKEAKKRGDYLIVGIHGDEVVRHRRGKNLPLMNLQERLLSVLGCRYVDDVLINAPYVVNPDMIASMNISEVVHGSRGDDIGEKKDDLEDRYRYPKETGIFTVIDSPSDFNIGSILERVRSDKQCFEAKFKRKMEAENQYYNGRYGRNQPS